MAIRILIADDHSLMRAGLRELLQREPDLEVVGEAEDGHTALCLARNLQPDILLLDLCMPGIDGIEVTRGLCQMLPQVRVLILTVHEDEGLLREAIRAGACGYIIKRAAESELINAIHAVWHGDMYVHPAMTRALVKGLSPQPTLSTMPEELLTPRELEILRLIARGYTNPQIAQELCLSVRTVEGHRANVIGKLNLRSRVELRNYAEQHGLLK